MGIPVNEMLDRMDARELAEYIAFDQVEPIGDIRSDAAAGVIASTIANCHRSKGKAFSPIDFMPFADKPEKQPMNMDEMKTVLDNAVLFGKKKEED